MRAVLHGGYVDYVIYTGMTERYPTWFTDEVLRDIYMDSHRYTFWCPEEERSWDYYEKTLVETFSVFLRKPTGEVFCTSYYVFENLYRVFQYEDYTNSGVAAFEEDCIEYVECQPGVLSAEYPDWFYEYFTEMINFPSGEESLLFYDVDSTKPTITSSSRSTTVIEHLDSTTGQVTVTEHCVFLRNKLSEIRAMEYSDFLKHYNPGPVGGLYYEY